MMAMATTVEEVVILHISNNCLYILALCITQGFNDTFAENG